MNFTLIKKHPYLAGILVLVGGVILYSLIKGGSSGSSSTSTGETAIDLQQAQLDAATNVALSQQTTQQNIAQIAANSQDAQTAAQLALGLSQIQAGTVQNATNDATAITLQENQLTEQHYEVGTQAIVEQSKNQLEADTAVHLAQIAGDVQTQAIDSQTQIYLKQLQNTEDLQTAVVAGASKDKSRSSTGWTQIISALFGQGPEAIAANQPSNVANSASSILTGIGTVVSGIFG